MDDPVNRIITADVLAKASTAVIVDIAFTATLLSGYDTNTTQIQIVDAITTFFSTLGLGDPVQQSDLVFYLRDNIPAIDNIILPFTTLCRRGSSGTSDLTSAPYEHFILDNTSITVTIV